MRACRRVLRARTRNRRRAGSAFFPLIRKADEPFDGMRAVAYAGPMKGTDMTLQLDAATAASVKHLADTLGVTPEEAVRRAVQSADIQSGEVDVQKKLQALDALCGGLNLDDEKA